MIFVAGDMHGTDLGDIRRKISSIILCISSVIYSSVWLSFGNDTMCRIRLLFSGYGTIFSRLKAGYASPISTRKMGRFTATIPAYTTWVSIGWDWRDSLGMPVFQMCAIRRLLLLSRTLREEERKNSLYSWSQAGNKHAGWQTLRAEFSISIRRSKFWSKNEIISE